MEMADYRDDGIWEVVPSRPGEWPTGDPLQNPRRRRRGGLLRAHRGRGADLPAPRPRLIGWSLVFVGASNAAMVAIVIVVGMSTVGLVACAAFALSSWLLVLAEVLAIRRLYGIDQ